MAPTWHLAAMQQTLRVAHKKKEAKNAGKTRADRHSKKPHSPLPFGRGPDPWRCHGEVFNPSFQIVFNVSLVGLCLIFIFEL